MRCTQPSLHVSEDELIKQVGEKLSKYTIDPAFFKLAIKALAEEEDVVVLKDQAKIDSRNQAIEKATSAINNLRRMRYNGEADDDSWYFSEMRNLEVKLESLQDTRNESELTARNWRETADEVFTFARYAKEDFDSDDLEKKRTVIKKLGEELTILDRTIQFTPNKYFIPIEKMHERRALPPEMARTDSQQREIGSSSNVSLVWLRRLDSNQWPID